MSQGVDSKMVLIRERTLVVEAPSQEAVLLLVKLIPSLPPSFERSWATELRAKCANRISGANPDVRVSMCAYTVSREKT